MELLLRVYTPSLFLLNYGFKLWVESGVFGEDVIAGTGINNLKFTKPVYPEDTLYVVVEVIKKEERKRTREITWLLSFYNQNGTQVLSAEMSALVSK